MFKTIEGTADCEIRSVIRFLNVRNVLRSEIHHQICQVYGDNAMSDSMVRKWVRMFSEGRENARPHSAAQTQDLITSFRCEQMDHPLYSSDLAPSGFHFFLHLKKFLGGKRFDDDDDLKDAVQKWLTSQAAAFYEEGIQKLVPRYDKCLNMAANMWKNSLKNVECDNNKILYETLLDFFYSETVLNF